MRLQDLLKLQQPAEDLNDLRAQAVSRRALAPRSRPDPMLDIAQEAQACFAAAAESVRGRLHQDQEKVFQGLQFEMTETLKEVEAEHAAHLKFLNSMGLDGKERQRIVREQKSGVLQKEATISNDPILFQLRDINQLNSLETTIRDEPRHRPDAIPVQFRILSRKNEKYGVNKESTPLANTPENFYDLLMGTAEDEFLSDQEPLTQVFAQGKDGCFVLTRNSTNNYEESNASGDCPYAAVVAVTFHNKTEGTKTCSVEFSLSSRNFAGVYGKVDTWETLFETTSESNQTGGEVSFSVPPRRSFILMAVATPAYSRSSTGRRPVVPSGFVRQFLHVGLTHLKEIASCLSN